MAEKEFHIGDILSITTERLVSPRHVDGVADLLGWMVNEPVWTHQLPRVAQECAPALREQFPDLAAVQVPDGLDSRTKVLSWLDSLQPEYGITRLVKRLNHAAHTSIDPITEMRMMRAEAPVVAVLNVPGEL